MSRAPSDRERFDVFSADDRRTSVVIAQAELAGRRQNLPVAGRA
jgi:hypothetical protein